MRVPRKSLAGVVAATAMLAFGASTADAATAVGGAPKGLVQVAGGEAGWASLEYLKQHPDAVPGALGEPVNREQVVRPDHRQQV